MSAISDVGVNFKMTGSEGMESKLSSLENKWKQLSTTLERAPNIDGHFKKMAVAAEEAKNKISAAMNATKAVVLGILTAKAGSSAFDWAVGSEAVAKANVFAKPLMDPTAYKTFESEFSGIRKQHQVTKDDLIKGAYEINSAMSGNTLEDQIKTYKTMPYYMTMLNKSFTESAQFYKGLLASFGEGLTPDKQKTFAEDTLGYLAAVGQISKASPADIASATGKLGKLYSSMGQSQSQLFADIAFLSPMMGNKPEEAATALKSLVSRSGETVKKLAGANYEYNYVRGRLEGTRDWGSIENMKFAAKQGDKSAIHDLAEMQANKEKTSGEMAKQAEHILYNEKNMPKFWQFLGGMADNLRKDAGGNTAISEALGAEHSNAALGLIDAYRNGMIQKLREQIEASKGQAYIDRVNEVKARELPDLWSLVKQGAEDFSSSLRSTFYEPMKALLEEWRGVFGKLEKDFTGQGGLNKIKEFGSQGMHGLREGWNQGSPVEQDNRSVGQMFQDFISGLSPEDWRAAGQKIGKAASDFVEVMGQLKQIVGAAAKLINKVTEGHTPAVVAGGYVAAKTPGGPVPKAVAGGLTALAVDALTSDPNENLLGIPGSHWVKKGLSQMISPPERAVAPEAEMTLPSHRSGAMVVPPSDGMMTAHTPPMQPITVIQRHENVVQLDGREIAREVAPEVKEIIGADSDRSRPNATDWGHVGGN